MKFPRKYRPVVEIITRPFRGTKRQSRAPTTEPETEPPSPNLSSRKRRRQDVVVEFNDDSAESSFEVGQGLPISPTVSDFAMQDVSPTVSVLNLPISYEGEVTEGSSEAEDIQPRVSPSKLRKLASTPSESGSRTYVSSSPPISPLKCRRPPSSTVASGSGTHNRSISPIPGVYLTKLRKRRSPSASESGPGGWSFSQTPFAYEADYDETPEDNDLVIIGETPPDKFSDNGIDEDDEPEVPVRTLEDFVLYDMATNRVIPIDELLQLQSGSAQAYGASGIVKPWIEDNEDDEGEDEDEFAGNTHPGQRVKLSTILEFNVHDYSSSTREFDSKIYIRTNYAWYILDSPSSLYTPFFTPFYIKHRILHLIISACLTNRKVTYRDFLLQLASSTEVGDDAALRILGRGLTQEDLKSDEVISYIVATLETLPLTPRLRIKSSPLTRYILDTNFLEASDKGSPASSIDSFVTLDDDEVVPTRPASSRSHKSNKKGISSNVETEVLRHRNDTVVTPNVARIATSMFERTLEVAGQSAVIDEEVDGDVAMEIDNIQAHHLDPETMQWGELMFEDEDNLRYYDSVTMDGVTYSVGEVVMVNPGTDDDKARALNTMSEGSQSANTYGNRLWFCRICYFFEEMGEKMFHGQWFVHGSKTMLQETAHSKSLYLLNDCDDNPTATIFKKCNLKMLVPDDEEIPDDFLPDSNDFHCGLIWSEDDTDFLDIPRIRDIEVILPSLPSHKPCYACGLKAQEEARTELRRLATGYSQYNVNYHVDDCVYIRPVEKDGLLTIAQIIAVEGDARDLNVSVRHFGRYDDVVPRHGLKKLASDLVKDERCLFRGTKTETVRPGDIDGICHVRYLKRPHEIEDWVKHDDHFYVYLDEDDDGNLIAIDPADFKSCEECYEERMSSLQHVEQLLRKNEPLQGLELFSGAGGLGTGMNMSGYVETKYAVEFSAGAASTYRLNHPDTTVYCQDTNLLLKHAIESHEGKEPEMLRSLDGNGLCSRMPEKDGVGFVFGGAPCQAFSGINHQKTPDDIRSTLVCNMLSYVEFYQPMYFMLENVTGLLHFPLMASLTEDNRMVGGIQMGVVKLIQRTLIALGYQVRHKVLQAAQYGAPQGRQRVIFWGAKRGIQIPDFPIPTHCFPRSGFFYKQPIGKRLPPVTRSRAPDDYHQCAPLKTITVNDAIGDLPPFDWKNPHVTIPATAASKAEVAHRVNSLNIAQFDATHGIGPYPGYPEPVAYQHKPQNRYQKWLREGMKIEMEDEDDVEEGEKDVKGHYTRRYAPNLIERTVSVPLIPLADHKSLPDGLRVEKKKHSYFGRMDGDAQFRTAMTSISPNIKNTFLLHPSQKRIITVRECARSQGFPDHYEFVSINKLPNQVVVDQHRQIGNAVPVPLSLALGKSLGEALIKMWGEREREGSPTV